MAGNMQRRTPEDAKKYVALFAASKEEYEDDSFELEDQNDSRETNLTKSVARYLEQHPFSNRHEFTLVLSQVLRLFCESEKDFNLIEALFCYFDHEVLDFHVPCEILAQEILGLYIQTQTIN